MKRAYTWDRDDRLAGIAYSNPSGTPFAGTYGPDGSRVGKTDSGGTRAFLRSGPGVTAPVLSDGAATYTPGVSEVRGGVSTFVTGGLKNQDAQWSAAGAQMATRTYDAFGNVVGSSGTWSGPFGYGGAYGYQEDPSGLKLLGHRYYDPSTGSFLSRDPIKDGRNWYAYCAGDPVRWADPTGLILPVIIVIGIGVAVGAIIGAITDSEDRWRGAGRGAVIGGVAAGAAFVTSVAVASVAGAAGVTGVVGGVGAGAAGGFAGSMTSQAVSIKLGWQNDLDWWHVAAGTVTGGCSGAIAIRPVPIRGSIEVTHYGPPSPWVQVGGASRWSRLMAGNPKGEPNSFFVDAGTLTSPGGIEWGKGLLGQRIIPGSR